MTECSYRKSIKVGAELTERITSCKNIAQTSKRCFKGFEC